MRTSSTRHNRHKRPSFLARSIAGETYFPLSGHTYLTHSKVHSLYASPATETVQCPPIIKGKKLDPELVSYLTVASSTKERPRTAASGAFILPRQYRKGSVKAKMDAHSSKNSKRSESIPTLSDKDLRSLYACRCQDARIKFLEYQEDRFVEFMQSHSVNGDLSMVDMGLGVTTAKVLARLLSDPRNYISSLRLTKNALGDSGATLLSKGLAKAKSLVHLDLTSNGISRKGAEDLFHSLSANCSLVCLAIGNVNGLYRNWYTEKAMVELGLSLKKNITLTFLDLKNASIGNNGLKSLLSGLKLSRSLKVLNVSSNGLTSAAVPTLLELMSETIIERLDLSKNELGNAFEVGLGKYAYQHQICLTHLNLSCCGFTGHGAKQMFEALRNTRFLTCLEVDAIKIEPGELECLTQFLSNNKQLKQFSIKTSGLADAGLRCISYGLAENAILEELYLSNNNLGAEGIRTFTNKIKENEKCALKHIDLSYNRIEDDVAIYLAKLLRINTTLLTMDLSGNNLRNEFANSMVDSLNENPVIEYINIKDNMIEPKHVKRIEDFLKLNRLRKEKERVPGYVEEEKRYKANLANSTKIEREIQVTKKECEVMKHDILNNERVWQVTETNEAERTKEVQESMAKVNARLRKIDAEIFKQEDALVKTAAESENKMRAVAVKIRERYRMNEKIASEVDTFKEIIRKKEESHREQIESLQKRLDKEQAKLEIRQYANKVRMDELAQVETEMAIMPENRSPKRRECLEHGEISYKLKVRKKKSGCTRVDPVNNNAHMKMMSLCHSESCSPQNKKRYVP